MQNVVNGVVQKGKRNVAVKPLHPKASAESARRNRKYEWCHFCMFAYGKHFTSFEKRYKSGHLVKVIGWSTCNGHVIEFRVTTALKLVVNKCVLWA